MSNDVSHFDLVVIGGGPGGYCAAIEAAQHGAQVALVDKGHLGGTCLNRGCVPTKALLHAVDALEEAKHLKVLGVQLTGTPNLSALETQMHEVVATQRTGVTKLLSAYGITCIQAHARISGPHEVELTYDDERLDEGCADAPSVLTGEHLLIAAGSVPWMINLPGIDLALSSDDLLANPSQISGSLAIIGGGVIAVEFARLYASLGVEVQIFEALDRILPRLDKDLSQAVTMQLKGLGVGVCVGASVASLTRVDEGIELCYSAKGADEVKRFNHVLCAVGRVACTHQLFTEEAADLVELQRGAIVVNEFFETKTSSIHAIGDCIAGSMQLAHAASAQGEFVARDLFGAEEEGCEFPPNNAAIPSCVYLAPEVASVGLTEQQAIDEGMQVVTSKFPMGGNARAVIAGGRRSFMKLVFEEETMRLVGAHLVCERASDIIGELTLAVSLGLDYDQLVDTVRAHPTFSEAITEAVRSAKGCAIHAAPPRKRRR